MLPRALSRLVGAEQLEQLGAHKPMGHLLLDLTKGAFGVKEAKELVDMLEMNTGISTLKVHARVCSLRFGHFA